MIEQKLVKLQQPSIMDINANKKEFFFYIILKIKKKLNK